MWQNLTEEFKDTDFTVIAVAQDLPEAARPWIEAAKPSYPCLIDREHHLAEVFNLVNVPQAIWIDEEGHLVRAPENAGATDTFRRVDRTTRQMTPEQLAEREDTKTGYIDAIRDWVRKGPASVHVLPPDAARQRLGTPDANVALAHVHFRLARWLADNDREDEARQHFAEASRLHPQSWNIWRQWAQKEATGLASGPEFWARVDALGDKPYYQPIDMPGLRNAS